MSETDSEMASPEAEEDVDIGTAARTRPLSFEEIIERRKNKSERLDSPKEPSRSADVDDGSQREQISRSRTEGWRLASMVVSSRAEEEPESDQRGRDDDMDREGVRNDGSALRRSDMRNYNRYEEPRGKRRRSASRERHERERERERERESHHRERNRQDVPAERRFNRKEQPPERRINARELPPARSPDRRSDRRDRPPVWSPEKRSDKRNQPRSPERKYNRMDRPSSPERRPSNRDHPISRSPERRPDKWDQSHPRPRSRSPEKRSDRLDNPGPHTQERNFDKQDRAISHSLVRRSDRRDHPHGHSPERQPEMKDRTSGRSPRRRPPQDQPHAPSPGRRPDRRQQHQSRSPPRRSEKRDRRHSRSPQRRADKRDRPHSGSPENRPEKRNRPRSPSAGKRPMQDRRRSRSPEKRPNKQDWASSRSPERKYSKREQRHSHSPGSKSNKLERPHSPEKKSDKRDQPEKKPDKMVYPDKDNAVDNSSNKQVQENKTEKPQTSSVEKKSDKWDRPPAGVSIPDQPAFSSILGAVQTTIQNMLENGVMVEPVQLTQATRPRRRLYIEDIPDSASERALIDKINAFFPETNPCLTCTINKERRQALIEFLTPDDATKALSFDGRLLLGTVLKIRRPKDYVEMPDIALEKPAEEVKVISDVVKDSCHKIFVAGIHPELLSSEELMEIASLWGPLKGFRFMHSEELGEPCAFVEFEDHSVTLNACAGLNGMRIGTRSITVVQAFPEASEEPLDEKSPSYDVPPHAKSLLVDATPILYLRNMYDKDKFLQMSKSEVEEDIEDIRVTCARFGTVKTVKIVPFIESTVPEENGTTVIAKDDTGSTDTFEIHENVPGETGHAESSPLVSPTRNTDSPTVVSPTGNTDSPTVVSPTGNTDSPTVVSPTGNTDSPTVVSPTGNTDSPTVVSPTGNTDSPTLVSPTRDEQIDGVSQDPAGKGESTGQENGSVSETSPEEPETKCDPSNRETAYNEDIPNEVETDKGKNSEKDILVTGSVLVEFVRKEAARVAAHELHGELFGGRVIEAGYVPLELYLDRFSSNYRQEGETKREQEH